MSKKILPLALAILVGLFACEAENDPDAPNNGSANGDVVNAEDSGASDGATSGDVQVDAASDPACAANDDCMGTTPVCAVPDGAMTGRCVECLDNTYCPNERPICAPTNECTDEGEGVCREDFDCEEIETPKCLVLSGGELGICVECFNDDDCLVSRPICGTTGRCVANAAEAGCETDDECGVLRNCVAETCVEPEL